MLTRLLRLADLDLVLVAVILLLLLALAGVMVAWQRAAERADAAERLAENATELARHHQLDARELFQRLVTARADVRHYRRRLARYEAPDQPITTVDQFLNQLFGGR